MPPDPDPDPDTPASPSPSVPPPSRPRRRLMRARRAIYRAAAPAALALVRLWWWACPIVRVVGDHHAAAALAEGPVVPVYWHQHQLHCARYLLDQRARGLKLGFLISPSVDAELPAALAARAGAHVIRGSSNNTGARALRDYFIAVRAGVSPGITPDGPSGPRYGFKPGAILIAQLTGRPLLPMAYCASRAWCLRTWDHFVLPLPPARVALAVGAPRAVPRNLDAAGLEDWQRQMAGELESLYHAARAALDAAGAG